MGVRLEVDAKLPRELSVSDTELCAVLSNALENALRAVSDQPEADRWVTLYCGVRLGKLLVEIQNPCAEGLVMRDGLPVSERAGHGYGCRSIQTIAERRGGLCEFRARAASFHAVHAACQGGGETKTDAEAAADAASSFVPEAKIEKKFKIWLFFLKFL